MRGGAGAAVEMVQALGESPCSGGTKEGEAVVVPSEGNEARRAGELDPQTIEKAIKRCIDISTRLGALEDELPPNAGSVIVQCMDEIDEMQRWLEGRE